MTTPCSLRFALPLALATLALAACSSSGGGSRSLPGFEGDDGHLRHINVVPRSRLHDETVVEPGNYGEGQTIAVLSTDLGRDHREFKSGNGSRSRVHEESRYLYEDGGAFLAGIAEEDAVNPANAVASLAAGRQFGVARDADILGVGVVQPDGYDQRGGAFDLTIKPEDMLDGIKHATEHHADILAIHTVVTDTDEAGDLGRAIRDAKRIAVVPVPSRDELRGNSVDATRHFDETTLKNLLIVGDVARNNRRPSNADVPPTAAARDRFLVAPGVAVPGALGNGSDSARYSGSFAAMGLVAGSAAVLNSYHEKVTGVEASPEKVTNRLLETADRSFSRYDPATHGRGLLDVRAALTEVQGTTTAAGMQHHSLPASQTQLGAAFGDALSDEPALARVLAVDSGDWPFLLDLRGRVRSHESWALDRHMDRLANMGWRHGEETPYGGYQITTGQSSGFSPDSYQRGYDSMSVWMDTGPWTVSLQSHADPYLATAYSALPELDGVRLMGGAPGAAHMASWREATGASLAWAPNPKLTLGSQVWTGHDGDTPYRHIDDNPRVHRAELMAAIRPVTDVLIGVDVAQQNQSEGLLGGYGSAALQPGTGSTTTATGATIQWRAAEPLTLFSRYEHGWTDVDDTNGLISGFDRLQTRSTALGAIWQDRTDTRWGFVYSEPLRVRSGNVDLAIPHGFDGNGGVRFAEHTVRADPSGREQNFELFMDRPLPRHHSALRLNVMYQLEPGHVADAAPAWAAAGGYQLRF
ncbi:S8 family serine peptidase [Aquisalimonas sp.]|uniref:S8 family serine peptidase n=1 Tax=unclassified Aquisalimonas TaxID=2644645 RepID=UPI0025C50440|nr:S8 family serine peptidase [Aquisalimonas sp.]